MLLFVSHEGQKRLDVVGSNGASDIGNIALQMTKLIEENVVDKGIRSWIMPEFSTTTKSDKVVAAVLMMGAMQKYFSYFVAITCGIPSVTLLGKREDWADLVKKTRQVIPAGQRAGTVCAASPPGTQSFCRVLRQLDSTKALAFWG